MTDEEVKNELTTITTLAKFKPNPHHYIIIDKWNRREYNKVKYKMFDIIEEEIDKRIAQHWVASFASFPSHVETPMDFWESYKSHLPLWSDINSNCYFKLKEN